MDQSDRAAANVPLALHYARHPMKPSALRQCLSIASLKNALLQ